MLVGLTYDLRDDYLAQGFSEEETAEFDRRDTIDGIEEVLQSLGYQTHRIGHIKALAARLVQGDRWDIVFNIAEGLYGLGRESQVPALLDAYKIPYTFSDPLVLSLTLHKGMTKHIVRAAGIPTPDFVVVKTPDDAKKIELPFPLFAKPVADGTGKGVNEKSRADNASALQEVCKTLLSEYAQPVLVETFLPGREFTVGVAGSGSASRSLGVVEVILKATAEKNAYSYLNKKRYEDLVEYMVVKDPEAREAEAVALASWNVLGCRDAGRVDLRTDAKGRVNFIEVNPLAGLNPVHSDLPILCKAHGMPYRDLIRIIMDLAVERIPK